MEYTAAQESTSKGTSAAVHPLAQVFEANVDAVFGFGFARCGSRHVAEEVASETFAEAARVYQDG